MSAHQIKIAIAGRKPIPAGMTADIPFIIGPATGSRGVLAAARGSPGSGVTLADVQRVLRLAVGIGAGAP